MKTNLMVPMQLASAIAVVAISATMLAGCFGPNNSETPWMAYEQKCEQLGFKRGTVDHTKCLFAQARADAPGGGAPAPPPK